MNKNLSAHDVFWLARYAHNTLTPLFKAAQQYESSIQLVIEMEFSDMNSPFHKTHHVNVNSHWKRAGMFIQSSCITTTAEIDQWANHIQTFIDTEQTKLDEKAIFEATHAKRHEEWMTA